MSRVKAWLLSTVPISLVPIIFSLVLGASWRVAFGDGELLLIAIVVAGVAIGDVLYALLAAAFSGVWVEPARRPRGFLLYSVLAVPSFCVLLVTVGSLYYAVILGQGDRAASVVAFISLVYYVFAVLAGASCVRITESV